MENIIHNNFNFQFHYNFDSNVEIWIDNFSEPVKNSAKRIFIQMEPNEIVGLNKTIIEKSRNYDYIFTFEEEILNNCNNSILFEFGTKWVDIDAYKTLIKEPTISFVCGDKTITNGHLLRQKIFYKQKKIQKEKKIFLSENSKLENYFNNDYLGKSKLPLFNSMFSIAIENTRKKYYFSEKLIDCLLCKTIPIYWGCKNINDYFNTNGFVVFEDYSDFIDKVNKLDEEFYIKRKSIIDENYEKALNWIDYEKRVYEKIKNIII